MTYDIYCDFDIEKHKQTYINYLEVLILENGKIVYAIPSHKMKAEQLCCEKLNVSKSELNELSKNHIWDYMEWLLTTCKAIAVWNNFYMCGYDGINKKQMAKLKKLKLNGLYKGKLTNGTNKNENEGWYNLCNSNGAIV